MERHQRILKVLSDINPLNKENRQNFAQGFRDDYTLGREDHQLVYYRTRDLEGKQKEGPRAESLLGTHPGVTRWKELTGSVEPSRQQALIEHEMELRKDKPIAHQIGQLAGTAAADLTQDHSRGIYWLMNAMQATGEVIGEQTVGKVVPQLYGRHNVLSNQIAVKNPGQKGKVYKPLIKGNAELEQEAIRRGLVSDDTAMLPKRGYRWGVDDETGDTVLQKRNYEPGMISALAIPGGIAINNGLGLLTPLGGAEGFKAAAPNPEDPTKTNNMFSEVVQKYLLGRTGNLLPWSEFKKVRPDVSLAEYKAYQADKYDNSEDWNPLDGDVALLGGVLKANTDGILGPEVSILGRSLPVTTGLIPFIGATAGVTAGAHYGHHRRGRRGAQTGLIGGLAGTAVGTAAGSIIENERRRRNGIENGELPL